MECQKLRSPHNGSSFRPHCRFEKKMLKNRSPKKCLDFSMDEHRISGNSGNSRQLGQKGFYLSRLRVLGIFLLRNCKRYVKVINSMTFQSGLTGT